MLVRAHTPIIHVRYPHTPTFPTCAYAYMPHNRRGRKLGHQVEYSNARFACGMRGFRLPDSSRTTQLLSLNHELSSAEYLDLDDSLRRRGQSGERRAIKNMYEPWSNQSGSSRGNFDQEIELQFDLLLLHQTVLTQQSMSRAQDNR